MPPQGTRAVLVGMWRAGGQEELHGLVRAAGLWPIAAVEHRRRVPEAAHFVGRGKLQEIHERVLETGSAWAVFDHALSPVQERNLARRLHCAVLDRTALILRIFALRARSYEGKLQVELARLRYLSTRLVRGWTHLERQRGGINLRGGPGEAQLELDRRLLNKRIRVLQTRLDKVRVRYSEQRRARRRNRTPVVALVGYTNAGKTTLFNRLTGAAKAVADKPFVTLDASMRRYTPANDERFLLLTDTVGFLDRLPHELVAAFSATLDEARYADLLLHVVNRADPDYHARICQVEQVISEIGAGQVPCIRVYNKIDCVRGAVPGGAPGQVHISATTGAGLPALAEYILGQLWSSRGDLGIMAHRSVPEAPV